jgi:hypothetical protein
MGNAFTLGDGQSRRQGQCLYRLAHHCRVLLALGIVLLTSAVPPLYAKVVGLVPLQLYQPNITMTSGQLDRPSQSLVMCPNTLERH